MRFLIVPGVAVAVALLVTWGYQEAEGARDALARARHEAEQLQVSMRNLEPSDPAAVADVCSQVSRADVALGDVVARLDRFAPLLAAGQMLPPLSARLTAADALLRSSRLASESGSLLCVGLEPLQATLAAGGSIPASAQALLDGQPGFLAALARAREANQRLRDIDASGLEQLGPSAVAAEATLRNALGELVLTAGLLVAAPQILGADRQRTYLLLSQNSDELRPTGGFIGTAGTATIRNGRIASFEYGSSTRFDTPSDQRVPPPEPLARYLKTTYWHLRDSNWWPDFRSSAEQALYFYSLRNPRLPDGVLAIDEEAVRRLLGATGPVFVPEYNETIGVDNLEQRLEYYVHPYLREDEPSVTDDKRKEFVDRLSRSLLARLSEMPADRLPAVARALTSALSEKHLLVYLREPALASAARLANWDGAMLQAPSDFLYVVNANLTPNKLNGAVREAASYSLEMESGSPVATLQYTLENTEAPTQVDPDRRNLYRDFLRVYVPRGSTLLSSTGFDETPLTTTECGRTSFVGVVEVANRSTRTIELRYQLPAEVGRDLDIGRYSLTLQHQPGLGSVPWEISVAGRTLSQRVSGDRLVTPAGAQLKLAEPIPLRQLSPEGPGPACQIVTQTPTPLSPPARVRIPTLGVDAGIVGLGVTPDGLMEAPENGEVVGWYTTSARPGWPGNVVMAGHVDWERQPAVFFGLGTLKVGEQIEVVAEDGSSYQYVVADSESFPADRAPITRLVGPTAQSALTLITCEGPFDTRRREYLERRVVRAYLAHSSNTAPTEERRGSGP